MCFFGLSNESGKSRVLEIEPEWLLNHFYLDSTSSEAKEAF